MLYEAPDAFSNYRRGVDYYDEGALIWLEADTIIRQGSGGKKSMDDFAHLFLGGLNTPPEIKTYTFDDVVNTLNRVQPYDWSGFLTDRVLKVAEHAPLGGIANSGWKLVYNDQPNLIAKLREQEGRSYDMSASVGLLLSKDGVVDDAIEDGIAARNGIGPGMKIIAVNGRKYSARSFLRRRCARRRVRSSRSSCWWKTPSTTGRFHSPTLTGPGTRTWCATRANQTCSATSSGPR